MKKLAICIPTYNRLALLRGTINRLSAYIDQIGAWPEVEICISDNASTDGSSAWLQTLSQRGLARIHIQRRNFGADVNYMQCADMAESEFIWFFGSDDLPTPAAISTVLATIRHHRADIFLFGRLEFSADEARPAIQKRYCGGLGDADRLYRCKYDRDLVEYLRRCSSLAGVFSYLSTIVTRRAGWGASPLDPTFLGTAYSHAQRLLGMVAAGADVLISQRPVVLARMGNDSFLEPGSRGSFRRTMLDVDGYGKVADIVFKERSKAACELMRLVGRVHNPWFLGMDMYQHDPALWNRSRGRLIRMGAARSFVEAIPALIRVRPAASWVKKTLSGALNAMREQTMGAPDSLVD